jgi:hypothetical protein
MVQNEPSAPSCSGNLPSPAESTPKNGSCGGMPPNAAGSACGSSPRDSCRGGEFANTDKGEPGSNCGGAGARAASRGCAYTGDWAGSATVGSGMLT